MAHAFLERFVSLLIVVAVTGAIVSICLWQMSLTEVYEQYLGRWIVREPSRWFTNLCKGALAAVFVWILLQVIR